MSKQIRWTTRKHEQLSDSRDREIWRSWCTHICTVCGQSRSYPHISNQSVLLNLSGNKDVLLSLTKAIKYHFLVHATSQLALESNSPLSWTLEKSYMSGSKDTVAFNVLILELVITARWDHCPATPHLWTLTCSPRPILYLIIPSSIHY